MHKEGEREKRRVEQRATQAIEGTFRMFVSGRDVVLVFGGAETSFLLWSWLALENTPNKTKATPPWEITTTCFYGN